MSFSKRRLSNNVYATICANIKYMGVQTGPFSTGLMGRWEDIDLIQMTIVGEPEKSALLFDLRARAEKLFADCRLTLCPVDVHAIKEALFSSDRLIAETPNVQQLIDAWLVYDQQRLASGEIVLRTRWKNARWTNDFWAFVVNKYGKNTLLAQIKPADARAFLLWLRLNRRLSNNTAQATVSHARVLLNYAFDQEWIPRNPFINFRRKMDTVERVTLTETEIRLFCTLPLESKTLETVRDVFFFMMLTGLSYADVERLTAKDIKRDKNGDPYIGIIRRKMLSRNSTVPALIPLLAPALALLDKYTPADPTGRLLPLQANAPFNRSIKQIAFLAGLDKSVSTKVARNSLATWLLNEGVPLTSVSSILGHSTTQTTQRYYTTLHPERVAADLKDLNNRLDNNGLFGITPPTSL